jgi:hypothetical protein
MSITHMNFPLWKTLVPVVANCLFCGRPVTDESTEGMVLIQVLTGHSQLNEIKLHCILCVDFSFMNDGVTVQLCLVFRIVAQETWTNTWVPFQKSGLDSTYSSHLEMHQSLLTFFV